MIDTRTEAGARVAGRLRDEIAIWLTTVSAAGQAQSSPVWFLWDGADEMLVFSRPEAPRIRNLGSNARVAANLDGDHAGGDVVTFEGVARIDPGRPSDAEVEAYTTKYAAGIAALGWTPESFYRDYSVVVRVRITRTRSWE